jgi:hypothetical protein
MADEFISYAHQDLPLKSLKKYAAQYDGVDMATLMGADEDNFPCLVRDGGDGYTVMWWNPYMGFTLSMNDDAVQTYALLQFLLSSAHPRFESFDDAQAYSVAHDWPRKTIPDE